MPKPTLVFALPLAFALLPACKAQQPAAQPGAAAPPVYEVYAVRYGMLLGFPTSELVAGADPSRKSDGAMMVWLLKGPEKRNVLVDAGFYRDEFMKAWKPADYRKPSDAVASAGIAPEAVTDIIVSHVHWDHLDGADLFPNAHIWIQRAEYEYYVGAKGEALHDDMSAVDAAMLAKLSAAGRVTLVDGDDQEIIPGIRVYTGGRHTFASQYATVASRVGPVLIASDNAYLYENLENHLAIGETFDAAANLEAQSRMGKLVEDRRRIVPGHDPAIFDRFPATAPGVARID